MLVVALCGLAVGGGWWFVWRSDVPGAVKQGEAAAVGFLDHGGLETRRSLDEKALPASATSASPDEAIRAFAAWTQRYAEAPSSNREVMVEEGKTLAAARRPAFKELIRAQPRLALAAAVPMVVRQDLPATIISLIEERVNDRGALRVYQGVGPDNTSPAATHRIAELLSGRTYAAHVYGRREESVIWLPNAAVNGVALDTELAVHDAPYRIMEAGERPDPAKRAVAICPVSGKLSMADEQVGQPITEATPALEVYGEIVYLCDGSHTQLYGQTLIQGEGSTGGPMTFTGILPAAPTPSIGNIKVLVIPMTFADQNDTPSTESTLYNLMRNVGDHFARASYGKLTLLSTVTPPVTLPHSEAWYVQKDTSNGGPIDGLGLEHSHARAEVRKLGYDDDDYDCIVVRLRGGARPAGGWGGGRSVWIYGDGADVTAHEVGHVFGLAHANFWDTAGTSAIGTGTNGEYGGYYDVMGGFGLPNGHYNAQAKNQIRWLPGDYVSEAGTSGLYRIYAQDQAILDPGKRFALKIRKDNLRTYWGELRSVHTGSTIETWTDNGLILGWKYPGGGGNNIQLIDTTPGSSFGKTDAPISLGRTFSDTEAGIHLTTLAVNAASSTDPKSVDVQVHFGDFPGNEAPMLSLSASAEVVPVNAPVVFTATALDADGDALAFSWQHFGDANYRIISPNAERITRTFTAAGTYVVTCTVSDMRGGSTVRSQLITVGNGGGKYTISGQVTVDGEGLPGVIVNANSTNGVITDSGGRYVIPNLAAGTYIMTPLLHGYNFTELFNNSAVVGPNFRGADFEASGTPRVTLTSSVPVTAEGGTVPGKFLVSRSGDASQNLVVNLTTVSGTAATADYTLSPVPATGSQGLITLTIPGGQDSLEVMVTPVNDTAAEGPESVVLTLAAGNGYLIRGNADAAVDIDDNDTTLPRVAVTVVEGKTTENSPIPASLRIQRSGSTANPLNVRYSLAGTALMGQDYAVLPGTAVIPAGAAGVVVPVLSLNDALSETVETVILTLSANAAYVTDPGGAGAGLTILDDDRQVLTVVASDDTARERNLSAPGTAADTATFLITRTGDNSLPLTIYYAMAGSTSGTTSTALHGVDYEALPGVLVIPAGQSAGAVTVMPRWDGLGEGSESVRLQLGAGPTNYQLGPANAATATLLDANDPPSVEVITVDNAVEGNWPTIGKFRLSVRGAQTTAVVVNYTLSGTASSGADYAAVSGVVSISGNGLNTAEINISPLNDLIPEDMETVILTLVASPGYRIHGPSPVALMQLRDDEGPTVFVDASDSDYPPAFAENSSGGPFYLSRTGSTLAALTVYYSLSGTALSGTDYTAPSGIAVIPAGAQGVEVQISPANDAFPEGTETIILTLAPGAYSRTPAASFYLTDDEAPAISVAFPTPSAAWAENEGTVKIPVTLSAPATAPVTVEYQVDRSTHDTATANGSTPALLPYWVRAVREGNLLTGSVSSDGLNWTIAGSQTISISGTSYLAGLTVCSSNTATASVATFDNVVVSGLGAGGTQGAISEANLGTPAVNGSFSLSGSVYTVTGAGDNVEGTTDQGYFLHWPISGSTSCTITARVLTQSNTGAAATAGVMIRETTGNTSLRSFMSVTPSAGFEYHTRNITAATNVKTSLTLPVPVWLRLQRAGASVSAFQSPDGSAWQQVGATQALALGTEVQAGLALSSFSEGTAAAAQLDSVSIAPGPAGRLLGRTVGFSAQQGMDQWNAGTYTLTGSGDGFSGTSDDGYFASQAFTGDFTLTARLLTTTGTTALRAGVMLRQTFDRRARMAFLGAASGGAPQFLWRHTSTNTAYGTGIDFSLGAGLLTFPPGTTQLDIPLTLTDDTLPEADETIIVVLRNANGARLDSNNQFAGVISDNDSPPLLPSAGFAAAAGSVVEGAFIMPVAVVLSEAPALEVSLQYAVTAGTALADSDFRAAAGTVVFAPGQTVALVPVEILNDGEVEGTETLSITLSAPVQAIPGSLVSHTLTIKDEDSPIVSVSAADLSLAESGDTAAVVFTRSGPALTPLTVNYSRAGTATAGTDYSGSTGTAVIPSGEGSITITLVAVQDTVAEGAESVLLTLTAGSYTEGTQDRVTLTILDDDRNAVTIEATGATAVEGGGTGELTVTRTGSTNASLSVNLTVTGTATAVSDYTTNPGSLTSLNFSAGQATRTITVTAENDALIEGNEMMLAQLQAGSYDIDGSGYASVRIVDNDIPPTVFISSPGAPGVVVAPGNGLNLKATINDDGLPQIATATWSLITGPGTVTFSPAVSADGKTAATFSQPGSYLVKVTASDGQFSASDQIPVTVGVALSSAPAQWISADVGPPTLRGFSGPAGNGWLLNGAGMGFLTNSDRAHMLTRSASGDGSLVVRLTSLNGNGQLNAEAGISIRDSMHRYSRRAILSYTGSSRMLRFRTRVTNNTTDSASSVAGLNLPLWMKLERLEASDTVAAFYAADAGGVPGAWQTIGTPIIIAMDAGSNYSMTCASGSDAVAATAGFDQLSLTPAPVGAGEILEDFGDGTQTGTYSYTAATNIHLMNGKPGGLDSSSLFRGQSVSGDFILTVLQLDATSGAANAYSGIMIRDCMDDGPMAFVGRNPFGAYSSFVWRTNAKGGTSGLNGISQKKRWLRFIRRGNQVTALHAADNAGTPGAWAQLGQPRSVFLAPTVLAGLSVCNGDGVGFNTAQFTKLTLVPLHPAPVVEAGSAPASIIPPLALAGTITDDGLPQPFTQAWSAPASASPVSFGNTAALATTASFTTPGGYTLRLTADDGMSSVFDDLAFNTLPPFAAWQAAQFPGGAAFPQSDPGDDPDKDGLVNLIEYALGADPLAAQPDPMHPGSIMIGGQSYFTITVPKNIGAADTTVIVEAGSALTPGEWSGSGLVTLTNTPEELTVRDSEPMHGRVRRFYRVRVTR